MIRLAKFRWEVCKKAFRKGYRVCLLFWERRTGHAHLIRFVMQSTWKKHWPSLRSDDLPATSIVVSCAAAREPRPRDIGLPTTVSRPAAQETTSIATEPPDGRRLYPQGSHLWPGSIEANGPWKNPLPSASCPGSPVQPKRKAADTTLNLVYWSAGQF